MRKGLPKKYAKMGFKRGWREYKKTLKSKTKPKRKGAKTMVKRRSYRNRTTNFLTSKTAMDGYMSQGGKYVVRKIIGGGPIFEAGVDLAIGLVRKNNTLIAQGIVEGITAYLPSLNIGGGTTGGVR